MEKKIIDLCCGGRMFWYQKHHPQTEYVDQRSGRWCLGTYPVKAGRKKRYFQIDPTLKADFRHLPLATAQFQLAIFDPPHLLHVGVNSWLCKKYGKLSDHWQDDLLTGFQEAQRVLQPTGILLFKWNDEDLPLSTWQDLLPSQPLFTAQRQKTHWLVFANSQSAVARVAVYDPQQTFHYETPVATCTQNNFVSLLNQQRILFVKTDPTTLPWFLQQQPLLGDRQGQNRFLCFFKP